MELDSPFFLPAHPAKKKKETTRYIEPGGGGASAGGPGRDRPRAAGGSADPAPPLGSGAGRIAADVRSFFVLPS